MSVSSPPQRPVVRIGLLAVAVAVIGIALTWTYLGMRAVMDIGGACATGGPYVPAQSCPEGASALLSVGIPLILLSTFAASGLALWVGSPTLMLPMWFILFGTLGWNFLEYAFAYDDDIVMGWLVPGIMFELMALPALALWLGGERIRTYAGIGTPRAGSARWRLAHLGLIAIGAWLGALSFDAWT